MELIQSFGFFKWILFYVYSVILFYSVIVGMDATEENAVEMPHGELFLYDFNW